MGVDPAEKNTAVTLPPDPYDLRVFKGPVPKPAKSEGGTSRKKPKRKNPLKASAERWVEIRAKKCQECRVCGETRAVQAHHLIRQGSDLWVSSDTENNVVGLCAQCHTDLHSADDRVKKIFRAKLTPDEVRFTDKTAYAGYVDDIYFRLRPAGRNPGTLEEK